MCIINSLDLGIGIENWRLAESKSECDISIPYSRESMSRLSPLQITHSQNLNFIQWHRQCIAIVTWGRKSPQVQVSRSSEYGDDSVGGADRWHTDTWWYGQLNQRRGNLTIQYPAMQRHWHNMRVTKYRPCLLSHDMRVCHVLLSGVRCPVMFIVWTLMHTWRVSAGQRATDTWTGVMHLLFVRLIIQRYTQCKNSCRSFCRVGSVFITFHCNLSAYSVQYQQKLYCMKYIQKL